MILVLGLLWCSTSYSEDYKDAFKKALKDHQYYFKYKDKTYTTDTKEKPFDFFEHGYKNYREAAEYMLKNYPNDKSRRCFLFKGGKWSDGWNDDPSLRNYLEYDKNGWKKNVITKSKDNIINVVFYEDNGCIWRNTYFKVFYKDKEFFDSRIDHKKFTSYGLKITLNINFYIDKDYNLNGKNELFIDAGYSRGKNWIEQYYFFEYDENSIKLVKNFLADDFRKTLAISDYSKNKFKVSEKDLIKEITKNFSENVYIECIEGDCINENGTLGGKYGDKYVSEWKNGKYEEKYVGEWKDGQSNGQGTYISTDGDKYVGEFKGGQFINGQGTYISTDGDKYVGGWKDSVYSGQGTLIYADGDKYVGEWKDGGKRGQGTLTSPDGTKFVGEWNEYDGIFTYSNGIKFAGEWKDGKPIK